MTQCMDCGKPSWLLRCKGCQGLYDDLNAEAPPAPVVDQPDLFDSDGNDPLG